MGKGVSEIVATVLMVLIVSSIGMAVFLYSMGYFSGITSARYESYRVDVNQIQENFRVVDAKIEKVGGLTTASLWIYNYGKVKIELVSLYINGIPFSAEKSTIEPFQVSQFVGTSGAEITGEFCNVRVVTIRGNAYDETFPIR